MRLRSLLVCALLAACAPHESFRRALITDLIPLGTERSVVEARLEKERLCRQLDEEDLVRYGPCEVYGDDHYSRLSLLFDGLQRLESVDVAVVVPPKARGRDPVLGEYTVEAMTKRTFVALGKELERRYGKGFTFDGQREWDTNHERISLAYDVRGLVFEGHTRTRRRDLERAAALGSSEAKSEVLWHDATRAFQQGDRAGAASLARRLLVLAAEHPMRWYTGNAIHHGHLMLGRVALADGDVATARAELLASADNGGSPQLKSFGPNMRLARDLLQVGERDVVRQYLALCRSFWTYGGKRLDAWDAAIAAGQMPDFGANLEH